MLRYLLLIFCARQAVAQNCTGTSANLDPDECLAWQVGYDSLNGANWSPCSDKRNDPCGCDSGAGGRILCSGSHITSIEMVNNFFVNVNGQLPKEWSAFTELTHLQITDHFSNLHGSLAPGVGNNDQTQNITARS